jgi:predicted amidohydrolase YtcJ
MSLLILDTEVDGHTTSVRVANGRIAEVGPGLVPGTRDDVVNAGGGALIPGLHDHHLHIKSAAAASGSTRLGPPDVVDAGQFRDRLISVASRARRTEWVRGVGYHESVAGLLGRHELDRLVPHIPVRIQHRSGSLWLLNSPGIERLALSHIADEAIERDESGKPTGRLWRGDHLLRGLNHHEELDLASFGACEMTYGVTGVTDATPQMPDADLRWLVQACSSRVLPLRVHVMRAVGESVASNQWVSNGPVKVLLDDARLPGLDELTDWARSAYNEGRRLAVHCVTRVQIALTVAALKAARSPGGDRIEHGALVSHDLDRTLASLDVVVVSQPNFVAERGDEYLGALDASDVDVLYRCQTLISSGVAMAAGTDAPFGGSDPWASMRAAVERRTPAGKALGVSERVSRKRALELFLGEAEHPDRQRRVAMGERADLCLLKASLDASLRELTSDVVRMTIVDGVPVYGE